MGAAAVIAEEATGGAESAKAVGTKATTGGEMGAHKLAAGGQPPVTWFLVPAGLATLRPWSWIVRRYYGWHQGWWGP